ncbi:MULTISPECIES: hypothetical protein [unclassified Sphingomonas]|jgi:hypothetical protein|uniref:hypothetical protein n=1 Tax=unclassified Sphingomonas TaxID=196159 RepID=UPI00083538FA|nr:MULTISPECIES: hypothetical protein [unclassified Sphingomonas]
MSVLRSWRLWTAAILLGSTVAAPAQAQFFFKPKDLRGAQVTGAEPGMVSQTLPDATPAEYQAALVWNLRAALNVAALQCQFEPGLLTLDNYNAVLVDHKDELQASFRTIEGYFLRKNPKNARAARTAFDSYQTRVYAAFSAVSAQYIFCLTAGSVGRDAIFAPRGSFHKVAQNRMVEMRGALVPWGEQQFTSAKHLATPSPLPTRFADESCWRRNVWQDRRCGPFRAS